MEQKLLKPTEVLAGYDEVSKLYPYIPSLVLWRSWEYAAYKHYQLSEPVLDLGCGDGNFFKLVWPGVQEAIGVDFDPQTAEVARRSGVYKEVINIPANKISFPPNRFASVFANCSLEHMDRLSEILKNIYHCLRPMGLFILSVVNDKFIEWSSLPLLLTSLGEGRRARALQKGYHTFNHVVNPLSISQWIESLHKAGFQVQEHIPIVPEITSRLFLFIDQLWHISTKKSEIGDSIYSYLKRLSGFPKGFRDVLAGVLYMENDLSIGSGAVFLATRME